MGLAMKTLAVANQKGGVGKSTFCIQTAHAALDAGLRVLLVDLDPQGSLGTAFRVDGGGVEAATASSLFVAGASIQPEVLREGFAIIRSDQQLEELTADDRDQLRAPAAHLKKLSQDYDFCIIDTPGALGENVPTTTAALIAADAVISPFAVGLLEAEPLAKLWRYLQGIVSGGLNPRLRVLGLIPSKVNAASREELLALDELANHPHVGKFVLPVILSEKAAVKQAIAKGKPVWRGVRGNGHRTAANEWKKATGLVLKNMGVIK